jgi:hypothetical protein
VGFTSHGIGVPIAVLVDPGSIDKQVDSNLRRALLIYIYQGIDLLEDLYRVVRVIDGGLPAPNRRSHYLRLVFRSPPPSLSADSILQRFKILCEGNHFHRPPSDATLQGRLLK